MRCTVQEYDIGIVDTDMHFLCIFVALERAVLVRDVEMVLQQHEAHVPGARSSN